MHPTSVVEFGAAAAAAAATRAHDTQTIKLDGRMVVCVEMAKRAPAGCGSTYKHARTTIFHSPLMQISSDDVVPYVKIANEPENE